MDDRRHLPPSVSLPLHLLAGLPLVVLVSITVWGAVTFAVAGPGENLAGMTLILSVLLMLPAVVAAGLWATGVALVRRGRRAGAALMGGSAAVSGLTVVGVVALWVAGR